MQASTQTLVVNLLTLLRDDQHTRGHVRSAARRMMSGQAQEDMMAFLGQCTGPNINGPVIGENYATVLADVADDTPE